MTRHSYPVWVDLLSVNPVMEIYTNYMLKQVGRFIYSSSLASLSRFANIKGYVLVELDKPLKDVVEDDVPNVGIVRIDVAYKTLPFVCAFYKIDGHPDKLCPTKRHRPGWKLISSREPKKTKG